MSFMPVARSKNDKLDTSQLYDDTPSPQRQRSDMGTTPSFLELVHRVSQRGTEQFAKAHAGDVTPRQLAVLRVLATSPGASQTALVEATGIDRSTIAEIVKRLLQRGLVKRRRSRSDARAYIVNLTSEGLLALRDAAPVLASVEASMLDAVPEPERQTFLAVLKRMVER